MTPLPITATDGRILLRRISRISAWTWSATTLAQPKLNVTHVANGAIYSLNYDVVSSFEPVSMLTIQPMVIVAKKTMQADTLQDLIAWLRANPDKASQGTAGAGSTSHLAGIFFQMQTGARYQFVPYRNTGMQDLMAGL